MEEDHGVLLPLMVTETNKQEIVECGKLVKIHPLLIVVVLLLKTHVATFNTTFLKMVIQKQMAIFKIVKMQPQEPATSGKVVFGIKMGMGIKI